MCAWAPAWSICARQVCRTVVRLSATATLAEIEPALAAIGQTIDRFYLHLDMDALDPSEGRANGFAAPGGFTSESLQVLLGAIAGKLPVQALTVAGYDPAFDGNGAVCAAALNSVATVLAAVSR